MFHPDLSVILSGLPDKTFLRVELLFLALIQKSGPPERRIPPGEAMDTCFFCLKKPTRSIESGHNVFHFGKILRG